MSACCFPFHLGDFSTPPSLLHIPSPAKPWTSAAWIVPLHALTTQISTFLGRGKAGALSTHSPTHSKTQCRIRRGLGIKAPSNSKVSLSIHSFIPLHNNSPPGYGQGRRYTFLAGGTPEETAQEEISRVSPSMVITLALLRQTHPTSSPTQG